MLFLFKRGLEGRHCSVIAVKRSEPQTQFQLDIRKNCFLCLRHLWGKPETLEKISIHGMFTTNLDKALGIPSVAITSLGRSVDQRLSRESFQAILSHDPVGFALLAVQQHTVRVP